jgi:hypothetical protein
MDIYEIRVAGNPIKQSVSHINDYAAVRHAQRMAAPGTTLEVFRGGRCIFKSEDLGAISRTKPATNASTYSSHSAEP